MKVVNLTLMERIATLMKLFLTMKVYAKRAILRVMRRNKMTFDEYLEEQLKDEELKKEYKKLQMK